MLNHFVPVNISCVIMSYLEIDMGKSYISFVISGGFSMSLSQRLNTTQILLTGAK